MRKFKTYINKVLSELQICIPYYDDILIAAANEAEHSRHLGLVCSILKLSGLKINPTNCVLRQYSVEFFGSLITPKKFNASLKKCPA